MTDVVTILVDWIVGANGVAGLYSGTWATHVWASTSRVLLGFAIGTVLALILGVLVGRSKLWRSLMDPLIQGLRPVPITAWVPLAVIWFGIGFKPAIFLVVLGAFFPVYVNTVHAEVIEAAVNNSGQSVELFRTDFGAINALMVANGYLQRPISDSTLDAHIDLGPLEKTTGRSGH